MPQLLDRRRPNLNTTAAPGSAGGFCSIARSGYRFNPWQNRGLSVLFPGQTQLVSSGTHRRPYTYDRIGEITSPCTSVSRRSMPLWRYVSVVWSMPSRRMTVA